MKSCLILFNVFIIFGCVTQKIRIDKTLSTKHINNHIDTLHVNSSCIQIVKYGNGYIESIRTEFIKTDTTNLPNEHTISFHNNGVLSEVSITNDVKLEKREGYSVYVYKMNFIKISVNGLIEQALIFDKDTVVLDFNNK